MPKKKETRGRPRTLTPRQAKKNQAASRENWRSSHTRIINVRFNLDTDSDVLQKLDSVKSKTDYLRKLIRADIVANGFDN